MHTVECSATRIAKTQGEIKICTHSFADMTFFFAKWSSRSAQYKIQSKSMQFTAEMN